MKKYIIGFILGAIIFSTITAFAVFYYDASQITYNDTTLDHAIDELYTEASREEYSGATTFTPTTTTQTISSNNKIIKSDITINAIPSNYKNMNTLTIQIANYNQTTTTSQSILMLSQFAPFFKYYSITSINESTGNGNVCTVMSYGQDSKTNDTLTLNTLYNIASTTDGKRYTDVKVIGNSKTAGAFAKCFVNITFSN